MFRPNYDATKVCFAYFGRCIGLIPEKAKAWLLFFLTASATRGQDRSLVAECFDWIEVCGAIGRIEPKADADRGADQQAGNCPAVRENYVHLEPRCQQIADDDSKNDSEHAAGLRSEERRVG